MTIRAHGAGAKLIAGCLFAIAAVLTTTGLTVANSNASPSSCATGTATASPSPSPSASPTSTPSPSASPGQVTLCEAVSYKGSSGVSPGSQPPFSIEVSTQNGSAETVTVTLSASPSGVTPRFTNCPPPPANVKNTATSCTIGSLNGTQTFLAALDVPANASNGQTVSLGAQAKAANPNLKVSQWASTTVVKSTSTGGGGSPGGGQNTGSKNTGGSGQTGSNGSGGTGSQRGAGSPSASAVAAGTGNPLAYSAGPLRKFLPMINGGSPKTGGNIGAQLPSIPPAGTLPTARPAGYRASPSGPLSRQMLGTQLLALAALCAAGGIVLIKFWRRKPNPALAAGTATAATGAAGGTAGLAPTRTGLGRGGWRRFLPRRGPGLAGRFR